MVVNQSVPLRSVANDDDLYDLLIAYDCLVWDVETRNVSRRFTQDGIYI